MLRFAHDDERAEPPTVSQVSHVPNPLYATSQLQGIGGQIKSAPEDFVVEERPAYTPSGEGVHLYLWVEKRDVAAKDAKWLIAKAFGVANGDIGQAGNKDRRAITRQWFSVLDEQQRWNTDDPTAIDLGPNMRVLQMARHNNKLKTGHLWGNRFQIRVRNPNPGALAVATEALNLLAQQGVPNFYGPQRFGYGHQNIAQGLTMLQRSGGRRNRRDRFGRRMVVSALQGWLFNRALARRIHQGALHKALDGDIMATRDKGGLFEVEDTEAEQARLDAGSIVPTGPIYGHRMRRAVRTAGALEEAVLAEAGLELDAFRALGKLARGTRRHTLVFPEQHTLSEEGGDLWVNFDLPKGAYATVVLDELIKREGPVVDAPETFNSSDDNEG
ncbi:MAG: tRNA pseudouridine(13) synthase TruD [Myxococcota bacterium]